MTSILETIMLICFGCSWPISVYKNYKARTAAGMSKSFILLIITGYLAGISAKLISGNINYVLAAYLVNLFMVSANLVMYYRNVRLDKQKEQNRKEDQKEENHMGGELIYE